MLLFVFRTKALTGHPPRDKRTTLPQDDYAHKRRLVMKPRNEQTKRLISCFLLAVPVLVLIVVSSAAQEFRGSVTGRVVDPSGAAVPGAQVTITNTATNVPNSVTTNEDGVYTVLYLADGRYTVIAEKKGFK